MSNVHELDFGLLLLSRGLNFLLFLITLVWMVAFLYSLAYLFEKAGYQRWCAYRGYSSLYVIYEMTVGNGWFFLTLLIPVFGHISCFIVMYQLGRCFGKGVWFCIGLGFFPNIFIIILAFDKEATYHSKV